MGKSKQRRSQAAARGTRGSSEPRTPEAEARLTRKHRERAKRDAAALAAAERPPFVRRAVAFGLDWYAGSVLVSLPVMAALYLADADNPAIADLTQLPFSTAAIAGVFATVLALLYYVVVPWKMGGQTIGKKLAGVRIVPREGGAVSASRLVLRQVVGIMLVEGSVYMITALMLQLACWTAPEARTAIVAVQYVITALSAVLVVVTARRTALHDVLARTEVVRA